MLDESSVQPSSSSTTTATASRKKGKTDKSTKTRRLYGYGAERRSQPKTTDLIPKRWFAYSTVVLLLISSIASLNALAAYSPLLQNYLGDAGVAAFSLQGGGTFASWFASVLLAFAAVYCLQVYYLRKHRCDDYRGSYRLWLWAFIVFLVGSVSGAVDLGQITLNLVAATAGSLPAIGPVSIPVVVACVILTVMFMLAAWETRVSRGSMALLAVSWLAGLVSVLSVEPIVQNQLAKVDWFPVAPNAWLVFASCAFLAVLTYARYVYLAANGMLKVRQIEPELAKASEKKNAASKATKPVAKKAARKSAAKLAAKPVSKAKSAVSKPATKAKPPAEVKPAAETKPAAASNRMDEIRKRAVAQKAAAQKAAQAKQAKEAAARTAAAEGPADEPKQLSKSERRRRKKLERRQNRAA